MTGYLLLRDNKQTGPYSTEEIIAKGFKPYDLIWAEGKSAGWRYPGELPEFAAHAPMVEEQPFDRFYKKPGAAASITQTQVPAYSREIQQPIYTAPEPVAVKQPEVIATKEPEVIIPQKVAEPILETPAVNTPAKVISIPTRKIFVTLPGNAGNTTANPISTAPKTFTAEEARYMPAAVPEEKAPAREPVKENIASVNASYSSYQQTDKFVNDRLQPIEQHDKLYIAPKQRKNTTKIFLGSAVAMCLILGGVIIGLLISNNKSSAEQELLTARLQQIKDRQAGKPNITDPNSNSQIPPSSNVVTNDPISTPVQNLPAVVPDNSIVKPAVTKEPAQTLPVENNTNNAAAKTSERIVEEVSVVDKPLPPTAKPSAQASEAARKNIYELVSVSAGEYKVGVLGGISNLELTVTNNSLYPVDQLEVQLSYMNIEKKVVRTETVLINDIAAGEQKTVPVAKSKRGVSVKHSIIKINSRALGLAHSGL